MNTRLFFHLFCVRSLASFPYRSAPVTHQDQDNDSGIKPYSVLPLAFAPENNQCQTVSNQMITSIVVQQWVLRPAP
jgi:hypothetical protein